MPNKPKICTKFLYLFIIIIIIIVIFVAVIGLAVARKMIQDHGGNICVERTGREGTVFMLTLPIGRPLEPSTKS